MIIGANEMAHKYSRREKNAIPTSVLSFLQVQEALIIYGCMKKWDIRSLTENPLMMNWYSCIWKNVVDITKNLDIRNGELNV